MAGEEKKKLPKIGFWIWGGGKPRGGGEGAGRGGGGPPITADICQRRSWPPFPVGFGRQARRHRRHRYPGRGRRESARHPAAARQSPIAPSDYTRCSADP